MDEGTGLERRLAALAVRLEARGLKVELGRDALRVGNSGARGCCEKVAALGDTITCRSREDDGGRLWFFTSWGEPIAEAGDVTGAAVIICAYLSPRSEEPSRT